MVFKLGLEAQKHWRRLQGFELIPKVVTGVRFVDGEDAARRPDAQRLRFSVRRGRTGGARPCRGRGDATRAVDPAVLRVLKAGPWSNLPLLPATSAPLGLGLRKNRHSCEGWLARIVCEAEELIEDLIEVVEGRPDEDGRRGRRIKLSFPPHGLQSLLMQTELDASEPPGTVHVFDIVQTEASGRRGGIRVATVAVP
jgi:hypothetical protein